MLQEEFQKILNETTGERAVLDFLARNPNIIRWAVCTSGGHSTYVIKEFPFGSKYKADFIIPMSYSGAWVVHIIELEPHDDNVITKDGLPSNRLNKAISQIKDWKDYIEQNRDSFRRDLSAWCVKKDLLGYFNDKRPPTNFTNNLLSASDTAIWFNYYIIIGNRNNMNEEKRRRMAQYRADGIEVFNYGRILDMAGNFDKAKQNPSESINLRESSGWL